MPGGRPSKFTPELAYTICVHVRYGCPLEMAAAAEGVSAETVRRWRQRYPAFAAQVEQARASCTVQLLSCLNKAALGGNWKAAAWLLERTSPASYGPRNWACCKGNSSLVESVVRLGTVTGEH